VSAAIARLAELVERESGIRLTPAQHGSLLAVLERGWPGTGVDGFLLLASDPARGPLEVRRLLDTLTVKETSFLRDHRQLEELDWRALHAGALAAGSGTVRVWSAACATGEEVYTLALLACEAFGSLDPPVTILGTDISPSALAAAALGSYGGRSLRSVDGALRQRYFAGDGDSRSVAEPLRRLVRLAQHNLVRDPAPPLSEGAFDLILCRNVLIYFAPPTVDRVVASLERALAPGGKLVLGAADALAGAARRLAVAPSARPKAPPRERPKSPRDPAAPPDQTAEELLDPDVHFHRGLAELEAGNAEAAVWSLRRALYADPAFGLAAFALARAHEELGDELAARRAYQRALASVATDRERDLLDQIDPADVSAACRARLAALAASS